MRRSGGKLCEQIFYRRIQSGKQVVPIGIFGRGLYIRRADIDADNILIDRESYNELVNAIRLLPYPKDKIFMMKYVQDKSLKEIAIDTRLSIKQIYYHIHRGKKLLKSYLLNQKEREFDEKEHFQ